MEKRCSHGSILANVTGSGKTFIAGALVLLSYRDKSQTPQGQRFAPTLLLAPNSTLLGHYYDLKEAFPELKFFLYYGSRTFARGHNIPEDRHIDSAAIGQFLEECSESSDEADVSAVP